MGHLGRLGQSEQAEDVPGAFREGCRRGQGRRFAAVLFPGACCVAVRLAVRLAVRQVDPVGEETGRGLRGGRGRGQEEKHLEKLRRRRRLLLRRRRASALRLRSVL